MGQRNKAPFPLTTPSAVAVFTTVLVEGATSRVAIARQTGLTSAAVTKAVSPLIEAGLLRERGPVSPVGVGRPVSIVEVCPDEAFFAGHKVTSDEIISVLVDLAGTIRASLRLSLASKEPDEVVDKIGSLTERLCLAVPGSIERIRSVGVSLAGDIDTRTGLVVFSPFLNWRGTALGHLLQARLGLPAVVDNDVRALTSAERWFGAGVGALSFAVVTIGVGVGCGLYLDGRVLAGAHGVTGELGHVPVADPTLSCYCGGHGCVEAAASTSAILARITAARVPIVPGSLDDAITLARSGNEPALAAFAEAGRVVGLALAVVANLVGPDRIILTGEGVAAVEFLEEHVRRAFAAQAFGGAIHSELLIRPLPFEEWARGAATVALQQFVAPRASRPAVEP